MPEYMTKCEPVDKKPYIVYTDEKGILYSGDPDSDIPGGGGDCDIPKGYYVISRDSEHRLSKTWSEINTMYDNGAGWIFIASKDTNPQFVSNVVHEDDTYGVLATNIADNAIVYPYATDSANGYPMPKQG